MNNYRWTEQKSATVTDYVLGDYVTDSATGIRNYPYSTSAYVPLFSLLSCPLHNFVQHY